MSQYEIELQRGPMARRAMKYMEEPELRNHLANVFPTAMQTLLGVAQRAGSFEEIEIIFRYQLARDERERNKKEKLSRDLVERMLKDLGESIKFLARSSMGEAELDSWKVNAAAQQLSLIVRIHRAVYEERKSSENAQPSQERDRNKR